MACGCSDKKKLDYDYVRKLANAESITKQIDIQIYVIIGYDGKSKYYDYEPTIGGRKLDVVETIRFSQPKSIEVLSDNIGQEPIAIKQKKAGSKSVKRQPSSTDIGSLDSDSGAI